MDNYSQRMGKKIPKLVTSVLKTGDMQDYFAGLKIKKPTTLTPEQTELKIQADRVVYTLTRTMAMICVIAHMPSFLDNEAEILFKYLKPEEAHYILSILESYGLVKNIPQPKNASKVEELGNIVSKIQINIKTSGYSEQTKVDNWIPFVTIPSFELNPHLGQITDLICYNNCLKYYVMSHKNLRTFSKLMNFVDTMRDLKSAMSRKLYMTGTEEAAREKKLRNAYKTNILLTSVINEMEEQIEIKRKELGEELNKKVSISESYNQKIQHYKEEFQIAIGKLIHDSEKNMMRQCMESEEKQAKLSEEAKKLTYEYDTQLEDDLSEEKTMRGKRMKALVQLQSWFAKYDQDIGEKQNELEELQAQYDAERTAMDDLEDRIDEQAKEYDVLMEEKAEEERRIINEMALHFLMNRSAKIIQRAWRAYRLRRKRRKKKKKEKKGGKPKKK